MLSLPPAVSQIPAPAHRPRADRQRTNYHGPVDDRTSSARSTRLSLMTFHNEGLPEGQATRRAAIPDSGGTAVMEKEPQTVRKPAPRYRVLLHNDPVNAMEYVVQSLREVVPSLSEQDAIAIMLEAHNTGVGLVIVCDIEPAEFYCESLRAKGLTSSMEPES
jgi:ATP-dependent Clp protease adaptor protein ClpS